MKRFIIILVLFLAIGSAVVLWVSYAANPSGKVLIAFQGFTNDSLGARLATFSITNGSGGPVRRWGHYGLQTPTTPWSQRPQSSFGPTVSLRSGEAEVVSLPVPTNGAAWKAVLFYSRDGWRCKLGAGSGPWRLVPATFRLGVPTETWQSEWFDR